MISADNIDDPSPDLLRISSSAPETLARARFSGLPTMLSSEGLNMGSYEALVSKGGGPCSKPVLLGGVDPAVGVLDAGDLRAAFRGSEECCRLSCVGLDVSLNLRKISLHRRTYFDLLHTFCQLTLTFDIFW